MQDTVNKIKFATLVISREGRGEAGDKHRMNSLLRITCKLKKAGVLGCRDSGAQSWDRETA